MDINHLYTIADNVEMTCVDDADLIRQAAEKLAEYEGATVVEFEDKEYGICPLYNDAFCKCSIKPIDCIHWSKLKPSDCPLRCGVVIVKMKIKE